MCPFCGHCYIENTIKDNFYESFTVAFSENVNIEENCRFKGFSKIINKLT